MNGRLFTIILIWAYFVLAFSLKAQEFKILPSTEYAQEAIGKSSRARQDQILASSKDNFRDLKQKIESDSDAFALMTSPHYGLSVYQVRHSISPYEILFAWGSKATFLEVSKWVEELFPTTHVLALIDSAAQNLKESGDLNAQEASSGTRFVGLLSPAGSARSKPLEVSDKLYDLKDLIAEIEKEPIEEPMPESELEALKWYERHKNEFWGAGKNAANDKALIKSLYGNFWKEVSKRGEKREDYYAIITGRLYLPANLYFEESGRVALLQNHEGRISVHHEIAASTSKKAEETSNSEERGNRYIVFIRKDQLPVKLIDLSNSRRKLFVENFFKF